MSTPSSDPPPTLLPSPVTPPEPETRPIRRCAVITHGDSERTREALGTVLELVRARGGTLLMPADERNKHPGIAAKADPWDESGACDLVLVLGGDGTMLRALQRFLDTRVPVMGVNFGRVGFLTSLTADELAERLPEVLEGRFETVRLPTIELVHQGRRHTAINDVLVSSSTHGRMATLGWEINGVDMGDRGCDGVVVATAVGSTGYNLSAGGPIMGWGVDAMVLTFVAPHALDARPLVLSHSHRIRVTSHSTGFSSRVVVDGHVVGSLEEGGVAEIRLGLSTATLAMLHDRPFLARYRATFAR
jgi:NAD+ kinase